MPGYSKARKLLKFEPSISLKKEFNYLLYLKMKKFFDQICVIGLGFVGLTTALSFTNKKSESFSN